MIQQKTWINQKFRVKIFLKMKNIAFLKYKIKFLFSDVCMKKKNGLAIWMDLFSLFHKNPKSKIFISV